METGEIQVCTKLKESDGMLQLDLFLLNNVLNDIKLKL